VDCIIFATGFGMAEDQWLRTGYEVVGQNGTTLKEHFADGAKTLHGFTVHGFPNLFQVGLSQNASSVNFTSMFDAQAQHIAYMIDELIKRGASYAHPTQAATEEWLEEIYRVSADSTNFFNKCTPGWFNGEGKVHELGGGLNAEGYGPGINQFNELMAQWREAGELEGLAVR